MTSPLEAVVWCPECRGARPHREAAAYMCPACEQTFPIVNGIPRLLKDVPPDARQVQRVFDFEHRRFRDSWHTRFETRLIDQFLAECRLPREFFHGIRALDAGCGSGRWTYALAELGAEVVGFDLTTGGIQSAYEQVGDRANVSICQANIFRPPFEEESFDFVMSWGVLHHTPDTQAAFQKLVPLVKPGGSLFVMVYERHSPVMFFFTNVLRWFMRRLSDERRYRVCRRLVIRNRTLARLLGPFLMISPYDPSSEVDEQTLQFGLYDAYSPQYNHLHSRDEVRRWFVDAGFADVEILDMPLGSIRARAVRVPVERDPRARLEQRPVSP